MKKLKNWIMILVPTLTLIGWLIYSHQWDAWDALFTIGIIGGFICFSWGLTGLFFD